MKKLLLGIFTFLIGFVSFSSAEIIDLSFGDGGCFMDLSSEHYFTFLNTESSTGLFMYFCKTNLRGGYLDDCGNFNAFVSPDELYDPQTVFDDRYIGCVAFVPLSSYSSGSSSSSSSDITVYYNNGLTTSVACNGDNIITIDGLSTMSSISTFTPYFNINYTDQNNQILTESYSNNILYLSGGQYLKTYTGGSNNDWVLNLQSNGDNGFTGYLPTFDVTGNITEIDTGNVFNNFAENSLTVLLSNIPNYIQYVIMFALLLFVLGIFRKLRK